MSFTEILKRGIGVYKGEGVLEFIKQTLFYIKSFVYANECYYLYEKKINDADCYKTRVKIGKENQKIIENIANYYHLKKIGFDFKDLIFESRLKKGGIAFCIFFNKEIAHVTWVALNKKAKKDIDNLPFDIEFGRHEVCSGASFTEPKYRGKKLLSSVYLMIIPYLYEKGILKIKFTINVNNFSSNRAHSMINPKIIGKYRYLKILCWKSWKRK